MIDPALLPLLRDPRRALRAYGKVSSQAAKRAEDVLAPYDPGTVTERMQQDILAYWANPPRDPDIGWTLWMITLGYRQGGKSLAAEYAAYCRTAAANTWRHLCTADNRERARGLLGRVTLLHDNWDADAEAEGRSRLRFERKYDNEEWQATFAPVQIGNQRLSERVMRTQHVQQEPIGAAWDSWHWSEIDFCEEYAARYFSALRPGLITRHHAVVHWETTPNPGTMTPSVGFARSVYHAAKNRRAEGEESRFFSKFYPFWDGKLCALPYKANEPLELEELRLLEKYGSKGLRPEHLMFRRSAFKDDAEIRRDPETFGMWYPFDDLTCWPVLQSSTFKAHHLARQLGERLVPWAPTDNHQWYPGRRALQGTPLGTIDPEAAYVMAIDPNGFGGRDHGAAEIREVWADEQREVCSFAGGRREGVDPQTLAAWVIPTCRRFRDEGSRILVVVESNGVGAATIALLKGVAGVELYHTEPDKPGVASSQKSKQEALVNHQDALMEDLLLQDEDKFSQHQNYRNDKAIEETDAALQLQDNAPSRRRRPRHHWDKVSASMWASWAVAHGLVRRPFLPVVAPARTTRSPCTEAEWEAWGARAEQREYGGGTYVDYEVLP